MPRSSRVSRSSAAATSAVAVVAASLVAMAAPTAMAGSSGAKTPAIVTGPHYQRAGHVDATPGAQTFSCQLTDPAGCYGPAQIRTAYGIDNLAATGTHHTIVIIDAFQSPTLAHDLATFDQLFELSDPTLNVIAPDGLTPFDQNDDNMVGWAGEITLDVEWAHAIAPDAKIDLVLAKSNSDDDILSATQYAIKHNLGEVISQSFGEAEQCMDPKLVRAQHKLFAEATQRHITLLASSGDQGAAQPSCDGSDFIKATSTPASDPLVTGVGGTRLFANGTTGAYDSESVWNEPDFQAAGGGGSSVLYRTPAYQRSLHLSARGVPDISYNAAIIGGVLAVWSSSGEGADLVFRFGGTSAGSPQWAGLTVLANELARNRIGALNDRLYTLAAGRDYAKLFHDVTVGDNTFHGPTTITGFTAHAGWDAASGLGSPQADTLVPRLAGTVGAPSHDQMDLANHDVSADVGELDQPTKATSHAAQRKSPL